MPSACATNTVAGRTCQQLDLPIDKYCAPCAAAQAVATKVFHGIGIWRCRFCGCTENDCRQCIEKTGKPCSWVLPDLCSACLPEVDKDRPAPAPQKKGQ